MSVAAYELTEGRMLQGLPFEEAVGRWKAGDGEFWIDAGSSEPSSLGLVLDDLEVSQFLRTRCFRVGSSTIVLAVSNATFVSLPLYADESRTRRIYGAAVCLPRLILTFRAETEEDAQRYRPRVEDLELEAGTTSSLLMAFLLRRGAATAAVARQVRDELSALGEQMDEDPALVEPTVLEKLKRRISLLDAIAEEQQQAFGLIAHARSAGFDPSSVDGPLGLLTAMSSATARLVDRNDARIDNLLRRVQDQKTELLNRRLGLLTIVSAIFMPLTLLAGIWGMNFENMPELDHPNAYAGALSLMAFLALGATWIFYRRGWFD